MLSTAKRGELERTYCLLYGSKELRPKTKQEREQGNELPLSKPTRLHPLLRRAGMEDLQAEQYLRRTARELLVLIALAFYGFGLAGACISAAALGLEYLRLKRAAYLRAMEFEADYTALLISLASGVRTGLDPLVALGECARLFPESSLVRREIEKSNERIMRGQSEQEAIQAFAATVEHPDISLFRVSFLLARREGSSLAHCLQRLGRVTRQRQSFRRKIKTAVAMQKLSSLGIAGCAVVIGLFQMITNSQAWVNAAAHPIGQKIISVGLVLMVSGVVWMMRLTRSRI